MDQSTFQASEDEIQALEEEIRLLTEEYEEILQESITFSDEDIREAMYAFLKFVRLLESLFQNCLQISFCLYVRAFCMLVNVDSPSNKSLK